MALPFIHARPRYFGEVIAELLFWLGPEKILFGSDYAIWTPRWLVEKFWAYQIPEDIAAERGVQLTDEIKEKILGLNAARLYNIDIEAKKTGARQLALQHRGGVGAMATASVSGEPPRRNSGGALVRSTTRNSTNPSPRWASSSGRR